VGGRGWLLRWLALRPPAAAGGGREAAAAAARGAGRRQRQQQLWVAGIDYAPVFPKFY
jgi:hypothetical protein